MSRRVAGIAGDKIAGGTKLVVLMALGAGGLLAGYTYDHTWAPGGSTTSWQANAGASFGSSSITFGSGGSVMVNTALGTNPNDYEVESQLSPVSGGNYVEFVRSTSTTQEAGSGNYIATVMNVDTYTGSPSTVGAVIGIYQCVNGTSTNLTNVDVGLMVGSTNSLRTVVWGTTLWVYVNGYLMLSYTIPQTTGYYGGVGSYGSTTGAFTQIAVGHHDVVAPNAIASEPVASSILPTSVSLAWPATTDDANGIGMLMYGVLRNGVWLFDSPTNEFTDSTAAANTAYTYTIYPMDQHGNLGSALTLVVQTPPTGDIDPRRIGVQKNGSYWGGGGEQIDTLSGNVNFSIPMITAQLRAGQKLPLGLSYNSQNWRQDSGYNWQLGDDTGYGFGWTMQFGSVTPYYSAMYAPPDHYVFTDNTGAQYRLNVNNNNVWSSSQSVYVWFDATANRLHFADGSFWVMGCTSGGTEADAGTMYPTTIEDSNGNQILIQYNAAASLGSTDYNSSSRINTITDFTATYTLSYTNYVITNYPSPGLPHLTQVTNPNGIPVNFNLTYSSASLEPPFGTDSRYSGATTMHLASVTPMIGNAYSFTYDTASAGELLQARFPYGGCLGWGYVSFTYAGYISGSGRTLREAGSRYLDADSACSTQWNYTISRPDAPNTVTVHSAMTLVDASGVGSKTWNFCTTNSSTCQMGLLSTFVQQASAGGTTMQQDSFNWSQDSAGNSYISQKVTVHDPGTSNPQSAQTNQTLDQYGNVTQSVVYGFNNTSAPIQTYNNAYTYSGYCCIPLSSAYASNYVFNRLAGTSLTLPGNINKQLVTNEYDQETITASQAPTLLDGTVSAARGDVTYSSTLASTTTTSYYDTGSAYYAWSTTGSTATFTDLASNSYAAPGSIATESYSATVSYNTWMAVTSTTGANGEQLTMTYDTAGRPLTGTSPFGGVTNYAYSAAGTLPMTQTETGPNGVTVTTLDGFGRPILVQRGDSTSVDSTTSFTSTVYAPCACSPLGKIQKVSMPYASGGTEYWTTYTYDGLGRTLSVQKPDGASTTHYTYLGNVTTVTDPAGNWKTFTKDVLGNLLTVLEPDPCSSTNTLTTSYTYDWMNHVSGVTMARPNVTYGSSGCTESGTTTQTRTFVYSDAGLLTSATNPENGTVTYTYNSTNTLATKTDAKGQAFVYTYDSANRVTEIQKYPYGQSNNEDVCARVNYVYGNNPSTYSYSRLTNASTLQGSSCPSGTPSYSESYTYGAPGNVVSKTVHASGAPWGSSAAINYTYDTFGRTVSIQYPFYSQSGQSSYSPVTFTTTYDAMGRPSGMTDSNSTTWVNSAAYDYAGRLQTLTFLGANAETRSYNTVGQLASIGWSAAPPYQSPNGPTGTLTYTYSATHNNGQITQATDGLTGETTVYQYDSLKRLTSASNSAWSETFGYDGFGNLTGKTLNGTLQPIPVISGTNRLSGVSYDLNGNMTVGAGATMAYNEDNRMSTAQEPSGSVEYYYYTPDGKRFFRQTATGDTRYTLYGAHGEALGTYDGAAATELSVYFGGRRLWQASYNVWVNNVGEGAMFADRLGSNRYVTSSPASSTYYIANYYPYGDVSGTPSQDQVGFATYTQDSYTGLDYADQRMYASTYGRFNTPDPSQSPAPSDPSNPQSWNRFAYASSDPVNNNDPTGLDDCNLDDPLECSPVSSGYCPPEYQFCSDGSNPFPPPPGSSFPQPPPPITVPVNFGDGETGSLTLTPYSGTQNATLGFADAGTAAIAVGICTLQPEVCVAVAGIGAATAIVVAYPQIQTLIGDIINIIQSRRLYTAVASCSVHQDGTPNHASAGTVTGTGQGVSSGAAVKAAFSAAQANVFAQYGVGFHAQHCSFTVSQ